MGAAAAYQVHRTVMHRTVMQRAVMQRAVMHRTAMHQSVMAETAGEPIDYEQPVFMFPIQITLSAGSIGGVIALFVCAAGRVGG
jgi:hypothetical protein